MYTHSILNIGDCSSYHGKPDLCIEYLYQFQDFQMIFLRKRLSLKLNIQKHNSIVSFTSIDTVPIPYQILCNKELLSHFHVFFYCKNTRCVKRRIRKIHIQCHGNVSIDPPYQFICCRLTHSQTKLSNNVLLCKTCCLECRLLWI